MDKHIINSEQAPDPIGPYNHAVRTGNLLFISGQIPFDKASDRLITSGIQDETQKVMENLEAILTAAGATFGNVVKATIFLTDMGQFSQVNEVYGRYFAENAPARECIQVAALPRGVNVEISVIAAL
ncbi:MAG: reactive intermediate/imine deaminase [Bacteroidetes bacterium 47-18]|nr:MAG: reactive intermediate/imine deaminase [Bacteroidetes bacterium 47-18]